MPMCISTSPDLPTPTCPHGPAVPLPKQTPPPPPSFHTHAPLQCRQHIMQHMAQHTAWAGYTQHVWARHTVWAGNTRCGWQRTMARHTAACHSTTGGGTVVVARWVVASQQHDAQQCTVV